MSAQPLTPTILFIDDDAEIRSMVGQLFQLERMPCECSANPGALLKQLSPAFAGIVITDIHMPAMHGLALLAAIHAIDAEIPVLVLTGYGAVTLAVQAMQQGAYDFIEKPFDNAHLVEISRRALEKRALVLANRHLQAVVQRQQQPGLRILGQSQPMQQLRQTLDAVLDAPADVLIYGETGCGKELVARYLHEQSNRRDANFVAINCGAIPEHLIESELFGSEAGAYTGADKSRAGKFEFANGGTLFLDEIESTPLALQVKLLRVLEERRVTRLGSNQALPLDIRVVAASKADLQALSQSGAFRADLYYRLSLVEVQLPPLRERPQDIGLLFSHFAQVAAARFHKAYQPLTGAQLDQLRAHHWPGNVRELRNMAERYVLLGATPGISQPGTSGQTDQHSQPDHGNMLGSSMTLQQRVECYEKMLLEEALNQHRGSIKAVMAELGIARKTLYDKMTKYQLVRRDFIE